MRFYLVFFSTSLTGESASIALNNALPMDDEVGSDSRIIGTGFIAHGQSTTINVRLWVNDDADYNVIHGGSWSGQVKVISKLSNS